MVLSVLQWNVLFKESGDNILQLIQETNADFVCLQELTQTSPFNPDRDLPAEISKLGYHYYYQAPDPEADLIIGNGIFSKHPISSSRVVILTQADPANTEFPQFTRCYIESVIDLGEHQLTIGTAHLSYSPHFKFFPAKEVEAQKFIDTIKPNQNKYIVTGDFNATPDSGLIKQLGQIFKSADPDYSEATWTTKPFEMHGFSADTLDWRLDYVFTSGDIVIQNSEVVKTGFSDHLPILTMFKV